MKNNWNSQNNMDRSECKRCGTCCKKGGPALHQEDMGILMKGVIGPEDLITFRKGEPAFDPARGKLMELPCEMIKIRGGKGTGCCIFYSAEENSCSIYHDRPLECRLLKCWDSAEVERIFLKDLLARRDLFRQAPSIMSVIEEYERRFPVEDMLGLLGSERFYRAEELDEMFRQRVSSSFELSDNLLILILGRPLSLLRKQIDPGG